MAGGRASEALRQRRKREKTKGEGEVRKTA
jgi:hypothetical protein